MLTINISPLKGAMTTEDGNHFSVFPIFIKQGNKHVVLGEAGDIGQVDAVELMRVAQMTKGLPWKWQRLDLPEDVERAVVYFLNNHHERQDMAFDCYAFANLVCGVPQHDKRFARQHWNLDPVRVLPTAGETIFLMGKEEGSFFHAAVYIGHRLYLSVYGAGGELVVSSLQDMLEDFGELGAKWVWQARPCI